MNELQGKNVSVLMGPPASSHHSQYLQRYKKTGQSAGRVIACHCRDFGQDAQEAECRWGMISFCSLPCILQASAA